MLWAQKHLIICFYHRGNKSRPLMTAVTHWQSLDVFYWVSHYLMTDIFVPKMKILKVVKNIVSRLKRLKLLQLPEGAVFSPHAKVLEQTPEIVLLGAWICSERSIAIIYKTLCVQPGMSPKFIEHTVLFLSRSECLMFLRIKMWQNLSLQLIAAKF